MFFALDDDTQLLQRTVRDFARAEVAPVAGELDRTKAFPYDLVRKMSGLGWMGIPFPESVGGAGGTTLQYAIAVEELTRVDSSVAITLCAHTSLGTQPIYLFGSDLTTILPKSLARAAYCVPETKNAYDLLEEFRAQRTQIAIILDEYGGVAGLITLGFNPDDLFDVG